MAPRRKAEVKNAGTEKKVHKKLKFEDEGKRKLVDEDDDDDAGPPSITSEVKSTTSTRSVRGPTHMHCLAMQRAQGIKRDVEFNDFGQPIGKVANQMQSYIGVLARENVKISYEKWTDVPNDVKDLIWDGVNMSFNVDLNWKKECLKSANEKWRAFKVKLTKKYVYGRVDSPNLRHPPSEYPFIQQSDWSDFLVTRLTDNYKKTREKQIERGSQNIYPHHLSRKGYANHVLENVLKQPDNSQCGFYVMRYMKDIIESANFERISSLQLLFNSKSYSSVEIDEVRREWADSVLQVI